MTYAYARTGRSRSLAVAAVVAVLVLLTATAASAAPRATSSPPRQDSVIGTGTSSFFERFDIRATSGPNGENPTGQVTVRYSDGTLFFEGPVTCLSVDGTVAKLNVNTAQFGLVALKVTDSGAAPGDIIDGIPTSSTDCSSFTFGVQSRVLTGDLVVVDAPPAPTSIAQCRNGGFARFGFRNQGQCVASVVARARS